ncbi:MAG: NAD-dependent epimerase [Sediminicola sp.]
MEILVTGAAGFIGFHVAKSLLAKGHKVIGLDNVNDYYSVDLKFARLIELGIPRDLAERSNALSPSKIHGNNFKFIRTDCTDRNRLQQLFNENSLEAVCHLAAQAGVRYSIENPDAYIQANIVGFLNILECCRHHNIQHLVYASSSSVYGLNRKVPFSTEDSVDMPISLYAATKKSNELMAHTYSHLFRLPTTGLRFFTVYGPWGRPDMALYIFTRAILENDPIQVFNHGNMERDFTYIDDITEGVVRILEQGPAPQKEGSAPYKIYNIGNDRSVPLLDFIAEIEKNLGKKALMQLLPMQDGDVARTWADVEPLADDYGYRPGTTVPTGVANFIEWYRQYHQVS